MIHAKPRFSFRSFIIRRFIPSAMSKNTFLSALICLVIVSLGFPNMSKIILSACTTMVIGTEKKILAENYDFYYGHGEVYRNPSGLLKTALGESDHKLPKWRSRFSSVTFNQFAREMPTSGMNEKGLAIALMWNLDGEYPKIDPTQHFSISELQWIQYQLDQSATIQDVLRSLQEVHIWKSYAELHYSLCDATGECGILEFIGGKQIYLPQADLPIFSLTNNSYSNSIDYFKANDAESFMKLSRKKESKDAFVRAAWLTREANQSPVHPMDTINVAFDILEKTSLDYTLGDIWNWLIHGQPPSVTVWSIVYTPSEKMIHYRTRTNPAIRSISLSQLPKESGDCKSPALSMDIEVGSGPVEGHFKPTNSDRNRRIISLSFAPIEKDFPKEVQEELILYPDDFKCK